MLKELAAVCLLGPLLWGSGLLTGTSFGSTQTALQPRCPACAPAAPSEPLYSHCNRRGPPRQPAPACWPRAGNISNCSGGVVCVVQQHRGALGTGGQLQSDFEYDLCSTRVSCGDECTEHLHVAAAKPSSPDLTAP